MKENKRKLILIFFTLFQIAWSSFIEASSAKNRTAQQPANLASAKQNQVQVPLKIMYFNELMGNVHQNSSRYSQTLTTISCNHPVKIRAISTDSDLNSNSQWLAVTVGPYDGFILKDLLSDKRQECFQDKYSKFFETMKLSVTDLYYFGRLHDHYLVAQSKANIDQPQQEVLEIKNNKKNNPSESMEEMK